MSMTSTVAKIITLSIYTVLEGEHNEVSLLFKALEATPNTETGRTALFEKLCLELKSHTLAEQTTVYDKVKALEGTKTMIEHAEHEHEQVENLLNELDSMDIATDAWLLKLTELKQAVDHHVREEESKIFDTMHSLFTDDQARALADEFQERKNTELKKLKHA
jgi:hypothetical protein